MKIDKVLACYIGEVYGATFSDLIRPGREARLVKARAQIIGVLYYKHGWGTTALAELFNRKCHATAFSLVKKYFDLDKYEKYLEEFNNRPEEEKIPTWVKAKEKPKHGPAFQFRRAE